MGSHGSSAACLCAASLCRTLHSIQSPLRRPYSNSRPLSPPSCTFSPPHPGPALARHQPASSSSSPASVFRRAASLSHAGEHRSRGAPGEKMRCEMAYRQSGTAPTAGIDSLRSQYRSPGPPSARPNAERFYAPPSANAPLVSLAHAGTQHARRETRAHPTRHALVRILGPCTVPASIARRRTDGPPPAFRDNGTRSLTAARQR